MARKSYATEEIIKHLRTVEIEKSKGKTVEEIARQIGVHAVTLAKWKREYGGLQLDQGLEQFQLTKNQPATTLVPQSEQLQKFMII